MQQISTVVAVFIPSAPSTRPLSNGHDIEPVVARLISANAQRLVKRRKFHNQDYEDLMQELTLEWLRYRPLFNPQRSCLSTYATQVIENRIVQLIRHRKTSKRNRGAAILSLDKLVKDPANGWASLGSTLSESTTQSPADTAREECRRDLAIDTSTLLAQLPEAPRRLAMQLMTMSVAEVVRLTGVPRSTVNGSAKRLRRHFAASGFHHYLPSLFGGLAQND